MQRSDRPLRIGFLTTIDVNVGDDFIRAGIRAVLDRIGLPYEPLYVNEHDPESIFRACADERTVVWDKYWDADLFIQAGAPVYRYLLDGSSTPLNSEWYGWMWRDRILSASNVLRPSFLNLGAGSTLRLGEDAEAYLTDPGCAEFARASALRSSATTTRDPIASRILEATGERFEALPCPAFLVSARHAMPAVRSQHIGINLMRLGGHYQLRETFDASAWRSDCERLIAFLRALGPLQFIAHDEREREFMRYFVRPDERVFLADRWQAYLEVYSACRLVVANRVHGAVCAASYGVPSVIIGNDSRVLIGDYLAIPRFEVGGSIDLVMHSIEALHRSRDRESERLQTLRDETLERYARLIQPAVMRAASTKQRRRDRWQPGPLPPTSLRARLEATLPKSALEGDIFVVSCRVTNLGDAAFVDVPPSPVSLCYRWFDAEQRPIGAGSWRHTPLPQMLPPGKTIGVDARVAAPLEPGRFTLALTLLQADVAWFDDQDVRCGVRGFVDATPASVPPV